MVDHFHLQKVSFRQFQPIAISNVIKSEGTVNTSGRSSAVRFPATGSSATTVLSFDYILLFLSGSALLPFSFPLPDSLESTAALPTAEALVWRSCAVREHLVAAGPVARNPNKMFTTDYPRNVCDCFRAILRPVLDSLSIAMALCIPPFFAGLRGPVFLLLFPSGPNQSLLPASVTAIPLPPSPGTKMLSAPFKQAEARSRPTTR